MKMIYMGTPDFAVGPLTALIEAGHQVAAVITQPDKPKGRGKSMQMTPVKEAALSHNIAVYQPRSVKDPDFMETLRGIEADVIVVAAFGQLLPKEILHMPRFGCLNIHASLLPCYRGAAPIQWAVIDGREKTGVTIMQMDEGLDTGDMLLIKEVPLSPDETGGSLFDKLSEAGSALIVEALKALEGSGLTPVPQTGESCYAPILTKAMGKIDWNQSAVTIERLIRGLNPWPSAYTRCQGKILKIWEAQVLADEEPDAGRLQGQPGIQAEAAGRNEPGLQAVCGQILEASGDSLKVQTGKGILKINSLQLEGKKRMDTAAFLRGFKLEAGSVLG